MFQSICFGGLINLKRVDKSTSKALKIKPVYGWDLHGNTPAGRGDIKVSTPPYRSYTSDLQNAKTYGQKDTLLWMRNLDLRF